MIDSNKDSHKHYHYHYSLIPNNSDCFIFGCFGIVAICVAAVLIVEIIWKA